MLHSFFQYWGDLRLAGGSAGQPGYTVEVYDGSITENESGVLIMRCPLTRKNVNPMSMAVWGLIHAEFARAAELLRNGSSLLEVCEPAPISPLRVRRNLDRSR